MGDQVPNDGSIQLSAEYLARQESLQSLRKKEQYVEDTFDAPKPESGYGPLTDSFNAIEQFTQEKRDQQPAEELPFPIFHKGFQNLLFDTYKKHQSQGKPITLGGLFTETSLDLQDIADKLQEENQYFGYSKVPVSVAMYASLIAEIRTAVTEARAVDTEALVPGITPPQNA